MNTEIARHAGTCATCQLVETIHSPKDAKYTCPNPNLRPLEIVGLDTIVMGTAANATRHKYIQVIVDHATRYVWAYPTVKNSAAAVKEIFERLLQTGFKFGAILYDNAKNFSSHLLRGFAERYSIRIIH